MSVLDALKFYRKMSLMKLDFLTINVHENVHKFFKLDGDLYY